MNKHMPPSIEDIQRQLQALDHKAVQKLAVEADVAYTTLWKIRQGETLNPGIETVRRFLAHMPSTKASK